eukprot:CAMPEP_0114993124 /NCGR_PEP_ID=MMETSP0216-20121206/12345_1 /TAXON_ID=223996 /ORGANISM="Protocruzia adherens, Strain Boccale" /LENGTH=269 /DNA_ID=CAMNT_0002356711 /DNA_START=32 /DNA_END=841 /DNA_ORIENTATION=+
MDFLLSITLIVFSGFLKMGYGSTINSDSNDGSSTQQENKIYLASNVNDPVEASYNRLCDTKLIRFCFDDYYCLVRSYEDSEVFCVSTGYYCDDGDCCDISYNGERLYYTCDDGECEEEDDCSDYIFNWRYWLGGGIVLLLIVLIIGWCCIRAARNRKKQRERQQQQQQTQMQQQSQQVIQGRIIMNQPQNGQFTANQGYPVQGYNPNSNYPGQSQGCSPNTNYPNQNQGYSVVHQNQVPSMNQVDDNQQRHNAQTVQKSNNALGGGSKI